MSQSRERLLPTLVSSTTSIERRFSLNLLPADIVNNIETDQQLQTLLPTVRSLALKQEQPIQQEKFELTKKLVWWEKDMPVQQNEILMPKTPIRWESIPAVKKLAALSAKRLEKIQKSETKQKVNPPTRAKVISNVTKFSLMKERPAPPAWNSRVHVTPSKNILFR